MKKIILVILVLHSISSLAQDPNPQLFQTWYLESVQASDGAPTYHISEIEPTITPTLSILENLDFNGQGACNSFNGTFSVPSASIIETIGFSSANEDCGIPIHNLFEDSYFEFIQSIISYEIITEGNGLVLNIDTTVFGHAVFKNVPLAVTDFYLNEITVYPNPSNSTLFVNAQNYNITKIELLNYYTQSIKTIKNNFKKIDISNLSSGVYLIKIYTEHGIMNKKIIKN